MGRCPLWWFDRGVVRSCPLWWFDRDVVRSCLLWWCDRGVVKVSSVVVLCVFAP